MRFQIGTGGWPIGQWLIPGDTILDFSKPDYWTRLAQGWMKPDSWTNPGAGWVPPLNAHPMDDEALQFMRKCYPLDRHLIVPAQTFESLPKNKSRRASNE